MWAGAAMAVDMNKILCAWAFALQPQTTGHHELCSTWAPPSVSSSRRRELCNAQVFLGASTGRGTKESVVEVECRVLDYANDALVLIPMGASSACGATLNARPTTVRHAPRGHLACPLTSGNEFHLASTAGSEATSLCAPCLSLLRLMLLCGLLRV